MPASNEDVPAAPPSTASDRQVVLTALTASAVMLSWMGRSLLTGQIPFTGDLLHLHYPLRDFYARALAAGHRFDWMPSLFGGLYVVGEGQLGGYHPLHWLLYRAIPLDSAFALEVIAPYPFLFTGTFLFLRPWCPPGGAAFGALLFAFCGFNLSHGVHPNLVGVVAHVPWLLWAIHWTIAAPNGSRRCSGAAVIGLLTGSQLLLGHPQAVWFSGLIEIAYLAVVVGTRSIAPRVRGIAWIAAGKLVGVAIGAVQLLATFHAVERSVRAASDPSFATSFSLPPLHLLQLLHPYLFWGRVLRWNEVPGAGDEFAAYGGAVALALAAWWLALYPALRARNAVTKTDRLAFCAVLFALLGLWLALGSHGRLYYVQTWLPIIAQFRVPARYVLFTQLALAVVAAAAFSRLLARPQESTGLRRALWAPWAVAIVSAASAGWLALRGGETVFSSGTGILAASLGPAFSTAAAALLTLTVRGARWALLGLVLVAGCDQALYGLGGIVGWQDYLDRQEALGYLDTDEVPVDAGRLMHGGFPNIYSLAGYRMLDGYVAIAPAKSLDYRSPKALRLAEVRYVHTEFQDVARIADARPLSRGWYQLADPLPRARLLTQFRVSRQPAVDLEFIDIDDTALTTRELPVAGGAAGTAVIVRDDPGVVHVKTTTDSPQLLVLSESFEEGWTVAVDGVPVPLERVNGDFPGCVVPAGTHTAAFEFRPVHLIIGRTVTPGGWALALALVAWSRFGSRRRRSDTSGHRPE